MRSEAVLRSAFQQSPVEYNLPNYIIHNDFCQEDDNLSNIVQFRMISFAAVKKIVTSIFQNNE